ncbi:MAG: hypothetical protein R3250_11940 [Melioribacteraceae bacterium]|nr:hypothetical protein [Melioribacteraceae bacterium]
MKHKKLTLLFLFITTFLCGQSLQNLEKSGGYARLQSMGSNPYIIDPFYMVINPAWGAYYDNFIFGDLGSTQTVFGNDGAGQFVSANFRVTNQLTIGALLTRNDFNGIFSISHLDPGSIVNQINNTVGAGITNLNNNLGLMASYRMGRHKFGFGLAYAASSRETNRADGNNTEASASQFGLHFGYIGTFGRGLLLDGAFYLSFPGASYTPPNASETSFSQTVIGVHARAFYTLSPKFKVVPGFTFQSISGSADIATGAQGTTSSDLSSSSTFIIGVGIMYESGDFLFAGGPGFATLGTTTPGVENISPELSSSTSFFPIWNLGAEWGMLEWLYARFGYVSLTGSQSTETAASSTTVNETISTIYGPTGAYVGLGIKLGNLSIDGTVNSDVLRQGLNNIGGGGATFAYLSVSVAFE